MLDFLHTHHTGEDELLFPLLRERAALDPELMDRMDAQHAQVNDGTATRPVIQGSVAVCTAAGPGGLAGCLLGVGLFWKEVHNGGAWDWKVELGGRHAGCSRCGTRGIDGKKGEWGELNWYARVNLHRQIFYNVWPNIFYGFIGRAAGFPGSFLQKAAGLDGNLGTGNNTPGNRIERQMGINLYNRYGDPSQINQVILLIGVAMMAVITVAARGAKRRVPVA